MSEVKRKRNANIELLRIISIIMVSMLHALNKGGALHNLATEPSVNAWIAWVLEVLSVSAVNIFFLISGYFMIKSESFRVSKVIELVLQTIFYTLGALIVGIITGLVSSGDVSTYTLLNTLFPIHMDIYWFVTVYLVIYILSPILAKGLTSITRDQFKIILILMLIYECFIKSFLPFSFELDRSGYSLSWGLTVFLTGAYIRLYGIPFINTVKRGLMLFFISSALVLIEDYALKLVYARTGRFELLIGISLDYNHIFVYAAAIGLFIAFLSSREITGICERIILFLSPMTLGVYLIQENLTIRYEWMRLAGVNDSVNGSTISFILHLTLAIIGIFVIGCVVDYIRIKLFGLFKR